MNQRAKDEAVGFIFGFKTDLSFVQGSLNPLSLGVFYFYFFPLAANPAIQLSI